MAAPAGMLFIPNLRHDIYPSIDPTKTDLSQTGKTVLITGAGRGIGRSTALRYAEAGVGAIILCARTRSELDEVEQSIKTINKSITVSKYQLDVSDESQVAGVAQKVEKLDVLVNNAGRSDPWVPIVDTEAKDWWKTWEVHINGPYLLTKYFVPKMPKGGDIVNVSSVGAEVVHPGASAYQTSKFALLRFTEFTQLEYPHINCVSIHPGGILTELSKDNETIRPFLVDTAEMPAGFIVWLTKENRTWLAGRFLYANWDVDELVKKEEEIVSKDLLKMRLAV